MATQAEIDAGARLLSRLCHDGCECEGQIEPCTYPPCPCRTAAKLVLEAGEVERYAEKRLTCKHERRIGGGYVGSDGSSDFSWYCPDCGMSDQSKTPPRSAPDMGRIL